ncbi:MAG: redoxin domain-containing protein, partial [Phycisphaeraceae bacterium]|nr:redoxin domain-containing protein [Phycisphaeraceae bacterium]
YAINQRDTIAEARHFMQANQLDTHVLMDDRGEISFAYEANALPSTVIISDGKIAHYVQGAAPGLEKLIQKYIKTALTKDEAE